LISFYYFIFTFVNIRYCIPF